MQISAANNPMSSRPIEPKGPVSPNLGPVARSEDSATLHRAADLLADSGSLRAIRPEVVARGRALAADGSYPPPEVVNKLAALIVG
jgi:hypothetical protein